MNDAELKALVNTHKNNKYMYGDYVRVVVDNPDFRDAIRMVHPRHDPMDERHVAVYTADTANYATWQSKKVKHATRTEYVAYMRSIGEVPRDE